VESAEPRQPGQLIEGVSRPSEPERLSPRRPAPGSPEALRLEAELATRLAALSPAADARFVTWRPDGGPLPVPEAISPVAGEALEPARGPAWPGSLDPLDDFFYREDEASPGAGLAAQVTPGELAREAVALDEFLIFRLGDEEFGVEISRVLEVMRTPPVTEVPRAPPDILGVISVRGDVVTVVDPRSRLGLTGSGGGPARRVVVVDDGAGACGLLVDQVAGVVRLPQGALEPCPQALGGGGGEVFLGIGREQERLFTVLDTRALLQPLRQAAGARPA
jgi:purine-binding chemotaxis protein CheW